MDLLSVTWICFFPDYALMMQNCIIKESNQCITYQLYLLLMACITHYSRCEAKPDHDVIVPLNELSYRCKRDKSRCLPWSPPQFSPLACWHWITGSKYKVQLKLMGAPLVKQLLRHFTKNQKCQPRDGPGGKVRESHNFTDFVPLGSLNVS